MITFERAIADNISASQLWHVAQANEEMIVTELAQKWPDQSRIDRLVAQRDNLVAVAKRVFHEVRAAA